MRLKRSSAAPILRAQPTPFSRPVKGGMNGIHRHRHSPNIAFRNAARPAKRQFARRLRTRRRNLWRAQRRALERGARVPRAQRIASCRGRSCGQSEGHRLVGQHGRVGQAARHEPLLRDRREQLRLVLRFDRPDEHRSRHRQALRRELSRGHGGGLGARAGASRTASASNDSRPSWAAVSAACRRSRGA